MRRRPNRRYTVHTATSPQQCGICLARIEPGEIYLGRKLFKNGQYVGTFRKCGQCVTIDEINSRSEEHTSELQSRFDLVCRLLLEKKKKKNEKSERLVIG